MRRYLKVFVLFFFLFILVGCTKINYNMSINEDKSMNLVIKEVFTKEYLQRIIKDEDGKSVRDYLFSEDNLKRIDSKGYHYEIVEDDNTLGIVLEKNIDNIDKVSLSKPKVVDLGLSSEDDNKYYFYLEEGYLKNKYVADFKISDMSLVFDKINEYKNEEEIIYFDEMELSFEVRLPNSAISSNASSKEDDNKLLKWNFNKYDIGTISFQFEMDNKDTINLVNIVTFGIIGFISIGLLIWVIKKIINRRNRLKPLKNNIELVLPLEENENEDDIEILEI